MGDRKTLAVAVLVIFLLVIGGILFLYDIPFKREAISIAYTGNLSRNTTKEALVPIQIAIDEINKEGGIKGKNLNLLVLDTRKSSDERKKIISQLANSSAAYAIISPSLSTEEYETNKMPAIVIENPKVAIMPLPSFYWAIKNLYVYAYNVYASLFLITRDKGIQTAVIVTDEQQLSDSFSKASRVVLPYLKINLLKNYLYSIKDESADKIMEIVSDIKSRNPDMVIVSLESENGVEFFKEAGNQGLAPKLYVGGYALAGKPILNNEAILPKNLHIVAYLTSAKHDINQQPTSKFDAFDHEMIKALGHPANTVNMNAYESVYILKKAMEDGQLTFNPANIQEDRAKLMDALWAIKNFEGLRGEITPDGKLGYLKRTYYTSLRIENGTYVVTNS